MLPPAEDDGWLTIWPPTNTDVFVLEREFLSQWLKGDVMFYNPYVPMLLTRASAGVEEEICKPEENF